MNNSNTTSDLTDLPNRSGIDHEKPGYKQTKLGWIPEDWEVRKLGQLGAFLKGSGISKSELKSKGLPAIRLSMVIYYLLVQVRQELI